MTMGRHALQRLYLAEDLVRRRRADEYRRHVASQRAARIDPNPHQIDAVIFALERIPDGGCSLADEVGLGKTIEAGLVIAQLMAEGAKRVLVVTPKARLGKWKQELYALFGIDGHTTLREAAESVQIILISCRPQEVLAADELCGPGQMRRASADGRVHAVDLAAVIRRFDVMRPTTMARRSRELEEA